MKRIPAVFLAVLLMAVMLASCSGNSEKTDTVNSRPVPEAKYNPAVLDAGRLKNTLNTSDLWYPDGGDGHVYLYFVRTDSDFTTVYVDHNSEKRIACEITEGKHLVSKDSSEISFDIAFYDAFNCYDYISEKWYSRGDIEKIKSAFAGKTLAEVSDNSNTYVFNEDGTCIETYKNSENQGTWSITAASAIVLSFGNGEYVYTYDIDFGNEGEITGISQRGGRTFDII